MRVKALESFGGRIHMRQGEERELEDIALIKDLEKAGYIEKVGSFKENQPEPEAEGQQEPEAQPEAEMQTEPEEMQPESEENQAEAKGQQEPKAQPEPEVSNSDTGKRKRKKSGEGQ